MPNLFVLGRNHRNSNLSNGQLAVVIMGCLSKNILDGHYMLPWGLPECAQPCWGHYTDAGPGNDACSGNAWASHLWLCTPDSQSVDIWVQAQLPEWVFRTHLTSFEASEFRFNSNSVLKCRDEVLRDGLLMYFPFFSAENVSLPWSWHRIQIFPTENQQPECQGNCRWALIDCWRTDEFCI